MYFEDNSSIIFAVGRKEDVVKYYSQKKHRQPMLFLSSEFCSDLNNNVLYRVYLGQSRFIRNHSSLPFHYDDV